MPAFVKSSKGNTAAVTTGKASAKPPPGDMVTSVPASPESTPEHLTQQSLNVLHQFLSYADPHAADLLPLADVHEAPAGSKEHEIPILEWSVLYSSTTPSATPGGFASSINVRSHPDPNRHLFSVQSVIPGVTARQFWSLMASAENRKLWDSTVEEASVKRWLASELKEPKSSSSSTLAAAKTADTAASLSARVELLRFCSIFMVAKARDMVLLSVDARLPPKPSESLSNQRPEDAPLRLVSTSQSILDPSLPPRKGYTRFELRTGGFMVEDLGDDGVPESARVSHADIGRSPSSSKGSHLRKGLLGFGRRTRSSSSGSSSSKHTRNASESSDTQAPGSPSQPKVPLRDPRGPAVLVTQVSDLGEMAAWVPASVIKMVASTLVPRSIASVAKIAKTMQVSPVLYDNSRFVHDIVSYNITDKLGQEGGEWYRHRSLPAMVGQGPLRKKDSRQPADTLVEPSSAQYAESSPTPASRLSDVPEVIVARESQPVVKVASSQKPEPANERAVLERLPKQPTQAAITTAPVPKLASPPPRTTSLPGSPVVNRTAPSFPGSPNKPSSPGSPTSRPTMLINLQGLAPPSFPYKSTSAGDKSPRASPASPGMLTDSDAGLDDVLSCSTSSLSASTNLSPNNVRKRFVPMTPSEGTETVPGSVAGSDFEEGGRGDYLSKGRSLDTQQHGVYGLTAAQFRRATLHLAQEEDDDGQEQQEILDDVNTDAQDGDTTIRQNSSDGEPTRPVPTGSRNRTPVLTPGEPYLSSTPARISNLPSSPMSPAEKRSRLLSNEYFASHLESNALRSVNEGNDQGAGAALERKVRRLSNALAAEMERRQQRSPSGFSPQSLPTVAVVHQKVSGSEDSQDSSQGGLGLVEMLADALTESLPFVPQSEAHVQEQVRRVSAMLLAGSDALALTLAPGARESLGLRFDGLSTPSERSEPQTPRTSGSHDEEAKTDSPFKQITNIGQTATSVPPAKKAANLGIMPTNINTGAGRSNSHKSIARVIATRTRKPSIDSTSRSISISASRADVSACTDSVISLEGGARHSVSAATSSVNEARSSQQQSLPKDEHNRRNVDPSSSSGFTTQTGSVTGGSPFTTKTADTSVLGDSTHGSLKTEGDEDSSGLKSSSERSTNLIHERGSTKAIETLRELNRTSRRTVRAVKRNLNASSASNGSSSASASASKTAHKGYGAYIIGGLAYYSGYTSWYGSSSSSASGNLRHVPPANIATVEGRGGLNRPISTAKKPGGSSVGSVRMAAGPRIPANHSIGRRRTRANYRLENNAKLHPFPGSLSKRTGTSTKAQLNSDRAQDPVAVHEDETGQAVKRISLRDDLPPPISGYGVGRLRRYPTEVSSPATATTPLNRDTSPTISSHAGGDAARAKPRRHAGALTEEDYDDSWEDDDDLLASSETGVSPPQAAVSRPQIAAG